MYRIAFELSSAHKLLFYGANDYETFLSVYASCPRGRLKVRLVHNIRSYPIFHSEANG